MDVGSRLVLVLCLAIGAAGCVSQAQGVDLAGAAVYATQAVIETGMVRVATGSCWGECQPGEECNETSGLCVPAPCDARCPGGYECVWVDGKQSCEMPKHEHASSGDVHEPVAHAPRKDELETNQALCWAAGVPDCPLRPRVEEPDAKAASTSAADP